MRNVQEKENQKEHFWTDELREEVVVRYLNGDRLQDIGRDHGISKATMYQVKRRKWFQVRRFQLIKLGALACGYTYLPVKK